jgi:hypothetical protein
LVCFIATSIWQMQLEWFHQLVALTAFVPNKVSGVPMAHGHSSTV